MEIRSVTLFANASQPPEKFAGLLSAARGRFSVPVQSLRLGTTPFPDWLPRERSVEAAATFATAWQRHGVDYISLGPVQLRHDSNWLSLIPDLLTAAEGVFASVQIAGLDGQIDLRRCRDMAGLVRRVSTLRSDGFGNLFMGALAGCGPGHPFLPASYHEAGQAHFAIAVESGDLALQAIEAATTLEEARSNLVTAIETAATGISQIAGELAAEFDVRFSGLDFSLAPYPTDDRSLAGAMEALGLLHVGAPGGLFAAAFITEAIDRANFPRTGFSGLMLPVLEDSVLARRAAAGAVTLRDLLSYSAVCGVGLDTVPLPGDIDEATLTGILLDVAALSARLRKPLVARLMPLPGLAAGDAVTFDFPYFADSRVMGVAGAGPAGLLDGAGRLVLQRYAPR